MNSLWINFQSAAGEGFAKLYSLFPGSDYFKLLLISAVSGVVLVWLYRFVSFQKALKKLKTRIATLALEPFVFNDSVRISLFTPVKLIVLSLKYMSLSIPPLLILAGPVIWLLGLLNQVVGYQDFQPGDKAVISISSQSPRDLRKLELESSGNSIALSELVRSYPEAKAWAGLEIKEKITEKNSLILKIGNESSEIPLYGEPVLSVLSTSFWSRLFYPGSKVSMPSGLAEISINYPVKDYPFLGFETSWVIIFLIISMLSGLLFARVLKIQI